MSTEQAAHVKKVNNQIRKTINSGKPGGRRPLRLVKNFVHLRIKGDDRGKAIAESLLLQGGGGANDSSFPQVEELPAGTRTFDGSTLNPLHALFNDGHVQCNECILGVRSSTTKNRQTILQAWSAPQSETVTNNGGSGGVLFYKHRVGGRFGRESDPDDIDLWFPRGVLPVVLDRLAQDHQLESEICPAVVSILSDAYRQAISEVPQEWLQREKEIALRNRNSRRAAFEAGVGGSLNFGPKQIEHEPKQEIIDSLSDNDKPYIPDPIHLSRTVLEALSVGRNRVSHGGGLSVADFATSSDVLSVLTKERHLYPDSVEEEPLFRHVVHPSAPNTEKVAATPLAFVKHVTNHRELDDEQAQNDLAAAASNTKKRGGVHVRPVQRPVLLHYLHPNGQTVPFVLNEKLSNFTTSNASEAWQKERIRTALAVVDVAHSSSSSSVGRIPLVNKVDLLTRRAMVPIPEFLFESEADVASFLRGKPTSFQLTAEQRDQPNVVSPRLLVNADNEPVEITEEGLVRGYEKSVPEEAGKIEINTAAAVPLFHRARFAGFLKGGVARFVTRSMIL